MLPERHRHDHAKKKRKTKTILSNMLLKSKTVFVSYLTDTIPPTATIFSHQSYMNAQKISIDVIFSEACPGQGGFKCVNSSNCDVSWSLAQQFICHHVLYGSYSYRMIQIEFYCFNKVQFSFVGHRKWSCLYKCIFTAYH